MRQRSSGLSADLSESFRRCDGSRSDAREWTAEGGGETDREYLPTGLSRYRERTFQCLNRGDLANALTANRKDHEIGWQHGMIRPERIIPCFFVK